MKASSDPGCASSNSFPPFLITAASALLPAQAKQKELEAAQAVAAAAALNAQMATQRAKDLKTPRARKAAQKARSIARQARAAAQKAATHAKTATVGITGGSGLGATAGVANAGLGSGGGSLCNITGCSGGGTTGGGSGSGGGDSGGSNPACASDCDITSADTTGKTLNTQCFGSHDHLDTAIAADQDLMCSACNQDNGNTANDTNYQAAKADRDMLINQASKDCTYSSYTD